jgi:hypothetical protein
MSSLPLPGALRCNVFSLNNTAAQLMHGGDLGDSGQVLDLLKDRWVASLSFSSLAHVSAPQKQRSAAIEAYFASLRGMVNTILLFNQHRPAPLGTLRGLPALTVAAVQGANQLVMSAVTGATLLPGDFLGLSGRLYQVQSACTAVAGVITVPLVNRVRGLSVVGTQVVWDKPSIAMRRTSGGAVTYSPGMVEVSPIDLVEAISA